jgi:hypothetical protein
MRIIRVFHFIALSGFVTSVAGQSYAPQYHDSRFRIAPIQPSRAYAFPLDAVKLLPGSASYNAMQKDESYLLLLKPDRLLYRFYLYAGLPVKDSVYKGWERICLTPSMVHPC